MKITIELTDDQEKVLLTETDDVEAYIKGKIASEINKLLNLIVVRESNKQPIKLTEEEKYAEISELNTTDYKAKYQEP